MDEYIRKSDALKASKLVYIECLYLDEEEYEEAEADDIRVVFARDIENIPAADVEEVRHGVIQKVYRGGNPLWDEVTVCSLCLHTVWDHFNYCPNCGAKMDGKENENG